MDLFLPPARLNEVTFYTIGIGAIAFEKSAIVGIRW